MRLFLVLSPIALVFSIQFNQGHPFESLSNFFIFMGMLCTMFILWHGLEWMYKKFKKAVTIG